MIHCKINRIPYKADELKNFWNKIISIGNYNNFFKDSDNPELETLSRISNLKKTIINFRKHVNLLKNKLRTWENDYKFKRYGDEALTCDISLSHVDKKMTIGNNIQINKPSLFRRNIKESSLASNRQSHLNYLGDYIQYRKLFKAHNFKYDLLRMEEIVGKISKSNNNDISASEAGDLLLLYLIEEFNNLLMTGHDLDIENEGDKDVENISYDKIAVKFCIEFIDWTISKTSLIDYSVTDINEMKRHLNFIVKTTQEVISREDMDIQRINQETGYLSSKYIDADDVLDVQNDDYTDEARDVLGLNNKTIDDYGEVITEAENIRTNNYGMGYYEQTEYSRNNDDDYVDDENVMNIFEGETED